jgi:hypothetical protein
MVLTRFWYLLLVLTALAGVSLALVSSRIIDENAEERVHEQLRRDRFELEAALKLLARSQIDAIAPLAAHGDVRRELREANARRGDEVESALSQRLQNRLNELNRQLGQMAGDLLIATDARGIVVAQIGGGTPPRGAGLGAFPLVRRALEGYLRDDIWVFNDQVYRMAARPVIEGGQYVGAILHGKRLDSEFAQLLVRTYLRGASLAFFRRDQVFASAMADAGDLPAGTSAPRRDDMASPLAEVLQNPALAQGERTAPIPLPTGGLAIYSLVVGSAAHAQVGYAIARPVPRLGQPVAILSLPSAQDWQSLPWIPLGTGAALAWLVAMFLIWLERDRPLARFRDAAQRLARRDLEKLVPTEFSGALRTAAVHINEAIEKIQETAVAATKRKPANLDEILGPVPEQQSTPAFFAFATPPATTSGTQPVPPPPPAASGAVSAPAATEPKPPPPPRSPPPGGAKPPPPPGRASGQAAVSATPLASEPASPPTPATPPSVQASVLATETASGGTSAPASAARPIPSVGSTLIGMGSGLGAAPKPAGAVSGPIPPDDDDDDEGPTMVAKVPEELLAKASREIIESDTEQEAHFREVYEQFVATKKQCGEPIEGLTYEKFAATLRKNRDQILKRHDAKKVRFTVYVKDGKAALKATPIRD